MTVSPLFMQYLVGVRESATIDSFVALLANRVKQRDEQEVDHEAE